MDLDRLNKALATYEVAEHIFKIDDGKTLSECLKIVVDGQEPDSSTIAGAVKITRTKQLEALQPVSSPTTRKNVDNGTVELALKYAVGHGENSRIALGKNRTPIVMNGKEVAKSSFNDVVDAPHKDFERVVNDGELGWIKRKPSSDQVAAVKRAALKSRQHQKENFNVNESALAILKRHAAALKAGPTPGQASVKAHPSAAEGSVKIPAHIPSHFESDADKLADTRARIPDEFKPRIEANEDRSFGAIAKRTAAQQTIVRPKPELDNKEKNFADGYFPRANTVQRIDRTNDNRAPQWPVDLKSPRKPQRGFASVNGSI